jgi:hypothetical protein
MSESIVPAGILYATGGSGPYLLICFACAFSPFPASVVFISGMQCFFVSARSDVRCFFPATTIGYFRLFHRFCPTRV